MRTRGAFAQPALLALSVGLLGQVPARPRRVPPFELHGAVCGIDVNVHLQSLAPGVRSLALLVGPFHGTPGAEGEGEDLPVERGRVVREIDRAVFDALGPHPSANVALRVHLGPPEIACDSDYVVVGAVRERDGALTEDPDAIAWSVGARPSYDLHGPTLETPSGSVNPLSLGRGAVVLGRDPATGAVVPTVVRASSDDALYSEVQMVLSDGRRVAAFPGARYAVGSGYRAASELRPGDALVDLHGAPVTLVATRTVEHAGVHGSPLPDVEWPDNVFLDGLLVADSGAHPSPAPTVAPAGFAPPPESITWTAVPMSYDCQLATVLDVRALASELRGVALVLAPHRGPAGARVPMACTGGRVVAELPRALFETARAAGRIPAGDPVSLAIVVSDRPVRCEGAYDLLPCVRASDGTLALAAPGQAARWGVAGPSCLAEGTPIDTPAGAVPIESLREGATVVGWDEGHPVEARVQHVAVRTDRHVATFTLSNGRSLRMTAEHRVYSVARGGFVTAAELAPGDVLLGDDGSHPTVRSRTGFDEGATVYDLTVTEPHDYFAAGLLVHNY